MANNTCYHCDQKTKRRKGSDWYCKKCGHRWPFEKSPEQFRMKFGQYAGDKLKDIPLPYLHWVISNVRAPTLDGADYETIEEYVIWRDPKEEYKLDLLGEELPLYPIDAPLVRYINRDKKEHEVPRDFVIVLDGSVYLRKVKGPITVKPKNKYDLIVHLDCVYNVQIEAEDERAAVAEAESMDFSEEEPASTRISNVLINGDDDD